jgi:hypothetical protein
MRVDRSRSIRTIRRQDDEGGFAMVAAIIVSSVGLLLATTLLASGVHVEQTTGRDRKFNDALQVAEAGVDAAVVSLTSNLSFTGSGAATVDVPGGQYQTTVTTPATGWRQVISTGYVPSKGAPGAVARRLKVTYGPANSFRDALFSDNALAINNNNNVTGDVYSNGFLSMSQNSVVNGSVVVAQSGVELQNGAQVKKNAGQGGSVYTGGFGPTTGEAILVDSNALIEGDARAQADPCPTTFPAPHLNIVNSGTIQGAAVAAGTISGGAAGGFTPNHCEETPEIAIRHLPDFHWDPTVYDTTPIEEDVTAFQATLSSSMSGVYHVLKSARDGSDPVIDFTSAHITGDFILVTDARLAYANPTHGDFFVGNGDDVVINVVVLNNSTDVNNPAIDIENQLQMSDPAHPPAILFYSPGLIDVKNNGQTDGSVYAGVINIKNNADIAYSDRIARSLGFGPDRFERVTWAEIPAT